MEKKANKKKSGKTKKSPVKKPAEAVAKKAAPKANHLPKAKVSEVKLPESKEIKEIVKTKPLKIAVVYYSLDGNTEHVANSIGATVKADLIKIKPLKDLKKKGFLKYFFGGMQVVLGAKPAIQVIKQNINSYDIIVIGTPVWANSYVPAIKTFMAKYPLKNKKIALYCCYDGNQGKTIKNLKKRLKNNTFIGEKGFNTTLKNKYAAEIKSWALSLIS